MKQRKRRQAQPVIRRFALNVRLPPDGASPAASLGGTHLGETFFLPVCSPCMDLASTRAV